MHSSKWTSCALGQAVFAFLSSALISLEMVSINCCVLTWSLTLLPYLTNILQINSFYQSITIMSALQINSVAAAATDTSNYASQLFLDPKALRNNSKYAAKTAMDSFPNRQYASSQIALSTNRDTQRIVQLRMTTRKLRMSPREAVLRNSSCGNNNSDLTERQLNEDSQMALKVLLRHQNNNHNTSTEFYQQRQQNSSVMVEKDPFFEKEDGEVSTRFNPKLLFVRKDDRGRLLKRSMLGSVDEFIETYRKKSPPAQQPQQSRTNGRKSMKTERLPQLQKSTIENIGQSKKQRPSLAFIPQLDNSYGSSIENQEKLYKIKVPKVSTLDLKNISKNIQNSRILQNTYQTQDGIETGQSSKFFTGFEQVKDAEEFKKAQKAYLRHQESLTAWDQTVIRLKERLKLKKQSLLLEKQVADPNARIKDYDAQVKFQAGNWHEQHKKYQSSLRGANVTYTSLSNNPYSQLWAIGKPIESCPYIAGKSTSSRFGRITKYTETLRTTNRDLEKSQLNTISQEQSRLMNNSEQSMISTLSKFYNN